MIKKIFSLFIFFISFISVLQNPVFAADPSLSERWVCLNGVRCDQAGSGCSGKGTRVHRARLTTKPESMPLPGKDTYVVVVITTDQGDLRTTGDENADKYIFNNADMLQTLKSKYGFGFEGLFKEDGVTAVSPPSPVTSNGAGDVGPFEWADHTTSSHPRRWLALNYWVPSESPVGAAGGQQQGTFDFETAAKNCVKINWDPFGRIFDSQTLEPMSGARVTLYQKVGDTYVVFNPSLPENQPNSVVSATEVTLEDGWFSYVVPDGSYKLLVAPAPVADIAQVQSNYAKIYSDIYPVLTGDVIVQKGAIQHRDIPVATQNTNRTPVFMEKSIEAGPSDSLIVSGKSSHPFVKITAFTKRVSQTGEQSHYRDVGITQANNLGRFSITIDQSDFEKTDEYMEIFEGLSMEKVDLTTYLGYKTGPFEPIFRMLASFFGKVYAATNTTVATFEPIPQYLEGYAYDANGKPMVNATVGLYMIGSGKPSTQVKTDATGYYKILSNRIPNTPYTIRYTTLTGASNTVTTSRFIAQNQKYIVQNDIDPYSDTSNIPQPSGGAGQKNARSSQGLKTSAGASSGSITQTSGKGSAAGQKGTSTLPGKSNTTNPTGPITAGNTGPNIVVILTILFIVLLLGVVVIIIAYIKKNNATQLPM